MALGSQPWLSGTGLPQSKSLARFMRTTGSEWFEVRSPLL